MNARPKVAVVLGSRSDIPHLEGCLELLSKFDIEAELKVMSAHRQPDAVATFSAGADAQGFEVIIAAAGLAAHLPGTIAARTLLPVIGIPVPGGSLNGLDALLSIVQMPGGIPVATVTLGKAGGTNAAILAAQILSLKYPAVRERLASHRASLAGA
jgi:5-(carboxyamino)imidazole ribonucleotide mutase